MAQDQDLNKLIAYYFYIVSFNGDPSLALSLFTGNTFEIDNPILGNSKASFIRHFEEFDNSYEDRSIVVERSIASKDLVTMQTTQTWATNKKYASMNFFKFNEDGEIIAYWDKVSSIK